MPEMKIGLYPYCRHSSNPYHVCSEYCFSSIAETKKLAANNQPAGLKAEPRSSQPTATSVEAEKTGGCRHSSNPYHVCSDFCLEVTSDTKKNEPAGLKAEAKSSQPTSISTATVQAEKTGVHRSCRHSSNPYHVCSEFCVEVNSEPKKSTAKNEPDGLKAATKSSQSTSTSTATSLQAEKTGVNRDCRHSSNPYHVCSEYCFDGTSEPKKSTAKNEPENRSSQPTSISTATVQAKKTGAHRGCRHSSNPYHVCSEFCFEVTSDPKKSAVKNEPAGLKASTKSSQPTSVATSIQAKKTGLHQGCKYSSNPYHVCSEYCFEVTSAPQKSATKNEPAGLKAETKSSQPTKIATSVQVKKTVVHRNCRHSSNPYHVCSEDCIEVIAEPKKLQRDTKYPSNRYHLCVEYC